MTWDKEDFDAWKARSLGFFQFLRDRRQDLMERWADGQPLGEHEQALAVTYGDILGLNWAEDVAAFYGIEVTNDDEQERPEAGRAQDTR